MPILSHDRLRVSTRGSLPRIWYDDLPEVRIGGIPVRPYDHDGFTLTRQLEEEHHGIIEL